MKLVIGVIKPFKLDEVYASLSDLEIQDISVIEVKGYGRQKGLKEHYHGADFTVDFFDKTRIEFIVSERNLQQALHTIQTAAYSGTIGDGKIFVYEIE